MKIQKNSMVTFHYELKDADTGVLLESTDSSPKQYIHGVSDDILGALADALAGKAKGDNVEVTLSPEQAYGAHNPDVVGRITSNYVFVDGKPVTGTLKAGTQVEVVAEFGRLTGTVLNHALNLVDIDTNHPYAGKRLHFSVQITGVRAATASELGKLDSCNTGCGCC